MKSSDLRELTSAEINHKLVEFGEELYNLRAQAKTGQLENASRVRRLKKDIARCRTILQELGRKTTDSRNGQEGAGRTS